MVNFVDANRCEANWRVNLMSKYAGHSISCVCVHQHARNDAVPIESLSIGGMGIALTRVGRGVIPATFRELFFREGFECTRICVEKLGLTVVGPPEGLTLVQGPL